jgi:ABC-2 type transporter
LVLTFPYERPVFIREYSGGMYDVYPYFVSRSFFEIPIIAIQCFLVVVVSFYMSSLQGNFGLLYSGALLNGINSAGLVLAATAACKIPSEAVELFQIVMMPQLLFAGLWIRINMIPVWMRWIQWCIPFKYAMGILYYAEFDGLDGGTEVMETNDFYADKLWFYYMMIVFMIFIFRGICLAILKKSAQSTVY